MIALAHLAQALPLLETLGVCRIDDRGASCWSVGGVRDVELSSKIDRQLRDTPNELAFVPGRKNRFLVARGNTVNALSATSPVGQVRIFELASQSGENLVLLRISSGAQATSATILAKALVAQGEPKDVAFREGGKAQVEEVRLTLGPIVRAANRMMYSPTGGLGWRFGVDRTETSPPGSLAFEALGRDGGAIRFVDAEGRPYEKAKGEEIWRQIAAGKWDWRTPPEAEFAQFWPDSSGAALWVSTNVDPKVVHRLRIRRMVEKTQAVGPFALDPS